jgi:hypothetical protein
MNARHFLWEASFRKEAIYFMLLKMRFHRGPFSQLNQMKLALPTTWVSGTKPQNLLSWLLCRLSPIIQ